MEREAFHVNEILMKNVLAGQARRRNRHPVRALLLLTQPSVAILAVMLILMQWRVPTAVLITLTLDMAHTEIDNTEMMSHLPSGKIPLSIVKDGEIRYSDFPGKSPVILTSVKQVELQPAGQFQIIAIKRDAEEQDIRLQLAGVAGQLRTTSKHGLLRDHRVTQFDVLRQSRFGLWSIILGWLFFSGVGWFKLYQELKK